MCFQHYLTFGRMKTFSFLCFLQVNRISHLRTTLKPGRSITRNKVGVGIFYRRDYFKYLESPKFKTYNAFKREKFILRLPPF